MKLKTRSGAKKRVKITGTGKFKFGKASKRHLLSNKSSKAKGRNKYGLAASKSETTRISRVLPYAK
ncbi:MAG: 50S ribosomal protein L35 [Candidatus Gracilibacteria bacterium]|nr:50S ribosomal protein L35 [Candidatus Gracilibacteria bacterium]